MKTTGRIGMLFNAFSGFSSGRHPAFLFNLRLNDILITRRINSKHILFIRVMLYFKDVNFTRRQYTKANR